MPETNNMILSVDYKNIPGVLFCRWIDRDGYAFKIPRNQFKQATLNKFSESGEFTFRDKGCVYILFGEDMADEGEEAYIGESISIDTRLSYHAFSAKRWGWQEVLIFCRDDSDFSKSHLEYIEEQLILAARNCRIRLRNDGKNRRKGASYSIDMAYEKAAGDFVEGVKLVCGSLGYKLFEPLPTVTEVLQPPAEEEQLLPAFPVFTTQASDRYNATGRFTGVGKTFIVLAGSTIASIEANTIPEAAKEKREELQTSGIVDNNFRFVENFVFPSPAAAACVICGASVSAYVAWRGLKDFVEEQEKKVTEQESEQS